MSDGYSFSATKLTAIDAAHSNGKAAVLAADTFAMSQGSLQGTVEKHSEAIDAMQGDIHGLAQQVKAMARVMASQNISKVSENIKLAQEDLRRSLLHQMTEKMKEVVSTVEREVAEVSDTKTGLLKKIDTVEQHIMSVVGAKLDDAAQSRRDNAEKIEKIEDFMESLPAISEKNNAMVKQLETKLAELKTDFKSFLADQSAADREQDKATMALTSEVRTALEDAKDRIAEETKALSKMISKRENLLKEEMGEVKDMIDKENTDRSDSFKTMQQFVKGELDKMKEFTERKIHAIEGAADFKVRPCMTALKEMKRAIDEESCHRDTADKELARRIAKEIQERHHDEERLVSLTSTTQEAVAKLNRV